jgi:hypothetical protein
MPSATIIGSPASGAKTLRRVDYATERNGLETLTEIYAIRTVDRATIQPAFLTAHKNFSTSSTKYERMAVENFSFRAQDGDISELTVTYVGLTSASGLPGALVRFVPTPGAGLLGPNAVIQVEYLSTQTESELIVANANRIVMPTSINGTTMPVNFKPYYNSSASGFDAYYGYTYASVEAIRRGQFLVLTVIFQEHIESGNVTGTINVGGVPR